LAYMQLRKLTWWQHWLFSSAETCLFEAKNCHRLANSRTFEVLEIFQQKFQDFPGGVGTPSKTYILLKHEITDWNLSMLHKSVQIPLLHCFRVLCCNSQNCGNAIYLTSTMSITNAFTVKAAAFKHILCTDFIRK